MILGIDEVGRGPWAGPLVVGAVILGATSINGLTDSKKLSAKRRKQLSDDIYQHAAAWGLGWVHADELDTLGLAAALRVATIRAVDAIAIPYQEIVIDGTINFLKETGKGPYVTTMPKADFLVPSVSAASIIAKVARDEYMAQQAVDYPGYGFETHVGYGTAAHRKAIDTLGLTPLHRRSFAPIAAIESKTVSTTRIGREGEDTAQQYLEAEGFYIVERNWRTKWSEIDIIASKNGVTYFIEVKYRKSTSHGGGVGAVTVDKQRRMRRAAEAYMAQEGITDGQLVVITIDGKVIDFLEIE